MTDETQVRGLIQQLFKVCADLERQYPGRPFSPDGHPMGSIGEVIAEMRYGLRLAPPSSKGFDAYSTNDTKVEIKATGGRRGGSTRIAFSEDPVGVHVLVLRVGTDGQVVEEFNGPGCDLEPHLSPRRKNGQRSISLAVLREVQETVSRAERLATVSPPEPEHTGEVERRSPSGGDDGRVRIPQLPDETPKAAPVAAARTAAQEPRTKNGEARPCPACESYLFKRWPLGWDAHAGYTCQGVESDWSRFEEAGVQGSLWSPLSPRELRVTFVSIRRILLVTRRPIRSAGKFV